MSVTLTRIQPGMDQATQAAVINDNFLALEQMSIQHTVKDKTGVARILLGQGPDEFAGLKVSKPTFDVTKATADQLIFNSNTNIFKIVDSDTASLVVGSLNSGASNTVTVPHGVSGIPAVLAYVSGVGSTYLTANRYYSMSVTIPVAIGGVYEAGINYTFTVDTTNIYFTVSNYTSLSPITDIGTANFKYYILQETAN